jgi:hypothetical protein
MVRSNDLIMIFDRVVIGEVAYFKGLNMRIVLRILFAIAGRLFTSAPKLLIAAVTNNTSLNPLVSIDSIQLT